MNLSLDSQTNSWEFSTMILPNESSDSYHSSNLSHSEQPESLRNPYYEEELQTYHDNYISIHGYLSLIICLFGIANNVMNIMVLTRKNMINPTNAILTGVAFADMLVMLSYIPFTVHNYLRKGLEDKDKYTYGWAVFALFHAHFTVVNHTIATWLTVTVAIWRFMAVCYPSPTMRYRGLPQARVAITCTYLACIIYCIPSYVAFTVQDEVDDQNNTLFKVNLSDIAMKHDGLLASVNFWMFSVMSKLVPCIALSVLSFGLLKVMYEANVRRKRLQLNSSSERTHDRTTRMLLVVLFLFLITQFPSGILALLSGALGDDFFKSVYLKFGETMDILSLINSAVNFIIYCTMSRQFRITFAFMFLNRFNNERWAAVPLAEPTHTIGMTGM